jgi:plastocyanin
MVVLLGVACGGDDAEQATEAPAASQSPADSAPSEGPEEQADAPAEGGTEQLEVVDTAFQPKEATVPVGTKVVWTQTGRQAHSVSAVDGLFDSAPDCSPIDIDACDGVGDEFSFTFEEPGTYDYYCRVHATPGGRGMTATLIVE